MPGLRPGLLTKLHRAPALPGLGPAGDDRLAHRHALKARRRQGLHLRRRSASPGRRAPRRSARGEHRLPASSRIAALCRSPSHAPCGATTGLAAAEKGRGTETGGVPAVNPSAADPRRADRVRAGGGNLSPTHTGTPAETYRRPTLSQGSRSPQFSAGRLCRCAPATSQKIGSPTPAMAAARQARRP